MKTHLIIFLLSALYTRAALVAYWDFEEGSGTATESVSNTTTDSFGTGVSWSTESPGAASSSSVSFSGANTARLGGNLNAGDIGINGSGAKTIVSWIRTTQSDKRYFWGWSPENGLVAGADLRFAIEDGGKLRFEVSGGFARYDSLALNDGQWHMVAAIVEPNDNINTIDFYVDGNVVSPTGNTSSLINTSASGTGGFNTPNEVFFGSGGNTDQQHWIGDLDDFRIYDTALSDAQLDVIYNAIPEPSSILLMLGTLIAGGSVLRRRS